MTHDCLWLSRLDGGHLLKLGLFALLLVTRTVELYNLLLTIIGFLCRDFGFQIDLTKLEGLVELLFVLIVVLRKVVVCLVSLAKVGSWGWLRLNLFRLLRLSGNDVHHCNIVVSCAIILLVLNVLPLDDTAEITFGALFCRVLVLFEIEHLVCVGGVLHSATGLDLLTTHKDLSIQFLVREHLTLGFSEQVLHILGVGLRVNGNILILGCV